MLTKDNLVKAIKYATLRRQLQDAGQHIMLSYNWADQELVQGLHDVIKGLGLPVWMDIKGGIVGSLMDSMAEGVQGAAVIIPFMSPGYEQSAMCRQELEYSVVCKVHIVPCYLSKGYKAKDWLGFLIAGKKYITVSEEGGVEEGCEQLLTEINSILNKTGKTSSDTKPRDEKVTRLEEEVLQLRQRLEAVSAREDGLCEDDRLCEDNNIEVVEESLYPDLNTLLHMGSMVPLAEAQSISSTASQPFLPAHPPHLHPPPHHLPPPAFYPLTYHPPPPDYHRIPEVIWKHKKGLEDCDSESTSSYSSSSSARSKTKNKTQASKKSRSKSKSSKENGSSSSSDSSSSSSKSESSNSSSSHA